MAAGAPAYKVDDRSLLLPYYRRYLVDPILPHLSESLHPNTITHAGHALNLIGTLILLLLWPERGWPFVIAVVLLQAYLWCDNADGAHARRTGQCSPFGEFLDHGLDMLNTTYIAYLTATALGASPFWWVVIALVIPGAGVAAYWEQAQTGVFRLGLLNQVESVTVLCIALLTSAIFGVGIFERVSVLGVTLQTAVILWCVSTILFGVARGVGRVVAQDGPGAAVPALGALLFWASVAAAAALGVVSTIEAVTIATAGNVTMGMRMLSTRLAARKPRLDPAIVMGALSLLALCAMRLLGLSAVRGAGPAITVIACGVFGLQALLDTRDGVQLLSRAAQASVPAVK